MESGGVRAQLGNARVIARSGLLGPLRPDKYLKMAGAIRRQGLSAMAGTSLAAARRPEGLALVDERGALTWGELEARTDALAAALSAHLDKQGVDGSSGRIGLLARNHRGFVESLVATGKLGADLVLLNTAFSGPQLAELLGREHVDVLIYDQEYAAALADLPGVADGGPLHVTAWEDEPAGGLTIDGLVDDHLGQRPPAPTGSPHVVLLTSGTTGAPKGARRGTGGGAGDLVAIIERVPWRAEDTVVVAAPMFHAWGFGCLVLAATMANTVVMRRHFDPEETLAMAARHRAAGMAVVPVMLERIVGLPATVKDRFQLPALRFVTASGSAMEPTALIEFMDTFGDVVYSNYNATEAGMIATATPEDLRLDPRSAGRPVRGCRLRILGEDGKELPVGEVGQIAVLNTTPFEGYTHGDTQGPPRRLHADRRPGPARQRGPAQRRGPGRRHDHQRRRERVSRRGRGRPRRAPRRGRGGRDRRTGRVVRAAAARVRRAPARRHDQRPAPADPRPRPARQLQGATRHRGPRRAAAERVGQGHEEGAARAHDPLMTRP